MNWNWPRKIIEKTADKIVDPEKEKAKRIAWEKECAVKQKEAEIQHQKWVKYRKYDKDNGLKKHIYLEIGKSDKWSLRWEGKCKYHHASSNFDDIMKDFSEYMVVGVTYVHTSIDSYTQIWLKLKCDELRFLEEL